MSEPRMAVMTQSELAYIQAYYYACGRNDTSAETWRDPSKFAESYALQGCKVGASVQTWWERGSR